MALLRLTILALRQRYNNKYDLRREGHGRYNDLSVNELIARLSAVFVQMFTKICGSTVVGRFGATGEVWPSQSA